jgi:hypothetical protein
MHSVSVYVPFLTFYNPWDALVGVTYTVTDKGKLIAKGEPQSNIGPDSSVSFTPSFTPAKGHTYTITASVNDSNGNVQTRDVIVVTTT